MLDRPKALRWRTLTACLAALALAVGVAACGSDDGSGGGGASADGTTTIRLGYNASFTTPFLFTAKERRMFDRDGLKVEWVSFQTPNQILEAMFAGELDAGVLTPQALVTAAERTDRIVGVASLYGWSDPTSGYAVRDDAGINSIQDLRGKTVGVNNFAGAFDLYLRHALDEAGVDDTKIVELPIPSVISGLQSNQVAAGALPPLFSALVTEQYKGKLKMLFSFRDIPEVGDVKQLNTLTLGMTREFVNNNRDAVQQFMDRYVEASEWSFANTDEALAIWAKAAGLKPEQLKLFKDPFGKGQTAAIDMESLALDARLMKQYDYVQKDIDVQSIVDNSFAEKAIGE